MRIFLLYAFLLANGESLTAEREAASPQGHRPVRSMRECERIAAAQAERFRMVFATAENRLFTDVTIRCEKRPAQSRTVRERRR